MKTLEQLAREAGGVMMFPGNGDEPAEFNMTTEDLARFRAACRAEALEEAAKAAEKANFTGNRFPVTAQEQMRYDCAAAIRGLK